MPIIIVAQCHQAGPSRGDRAPVQPTVDRDTTGTARADYSARACRVATVAARDQRSVAPSRHTTRTTADHAVHAISRDAMQRCGRQARQLALAQECDALRTCVIRRPCVDDNPSPGRRREALSPSATLHLGCAMSFHVGATRHVLAPFALHAHDGISVADHGLAPMTLGHVLACIDTTKHLAALLARHRRHVITVPRAPRPEARPCRQTVAP